MNGLREAAQNLIDSMGPHQDLSPPLGAVDRLRAALADSAQPDNASQGSTVSGGERPEQADTADAPEGPREVLKAARLYISALEEAVQDYRGNPTSNRLDMIHDIVRNTGEDFRDALDCLNAQQER